MKYKKKQKILKREIFINMNIYQENLFKDILQIIVFAGVIILWCLPYIKDFRSNQKNKRNERRNKSNRIHKTKSKNKR